jgi:DNA processing protein
MSAIFTLSKHHPKYPPLLMHISDPPEVLFFRGVRGNIPINLERTVGIVGTRDMSAYGKSVTVALVSALVRSGVTIVSGMARGIDTVAHTVALRNGGQTIAVLGCGVDIVAPPGNKKLYDEIIGSGRGVVMSEFAPGVRPPKPQFITRNRIISGLSRGIVVVEGDERSGALITARFAAEQGREVFAVPGQITDLKSRASSILLKNGATLVESADDILVTLGL